MSLVCPDLYQNKLIRWEHDKKSLALESAPKEIEITGGDLDKQGPNIIFCACSNAA